MFNELFDGRNPVQAEQNLYREVTKTQGKTWCLCVFVVRNLPLLS